MMKNCICISLTETKYDTFAARWFQECLYNDKERFSFYIGMSSLLFWILCIGPQLVKHYQTKSVEGLAGMLLGFWLFGDSLNLMGSILTHQLSFQRVSAFIFVCMDLGMIFQFFYYRKKEMSSHQPPPLLTVATTAALLVLPGSAGAGWDNNDDSLFAVLPFCEPDVDTSSISFFIGSSLGWISTACYLSSRLAQIHKNHYFETKSEVGTRMFWFAVLANSLYSTGILLNFQIKSLPWLVGSLAVMCLDFIIIYQISQMTTTTIKGEEEQNNEQDDEMHELDHDAILSRALIPPGRRRQPSLSNFSS